MKKFNFHYGWVILAIGTMVVAGSLGFGRFSYSMILPSMQKGLALSDAQAGLIGSANMFGYFLAALIAGMLASKYGGRLVITVSLLWVAVTMAATALVNGIASLMLLRFLTGIGSAGANISIMGLCAGWFAPNRRGIASGVLVGGSGVAMAVTGFIVPRINALDPVSGWRLNWLIIAGLVGILGAAAMIFVRNSPIGMGLTPIGAKGKKTAQEKERMTFKDMVAIPQMRKIILLYFCFGMSYIIYATFFVPYLVTEKGLSEALAGSIWSMVGLLSIGSAVIWGAL